MTTILVRTIFIYIFLLFTMRLMGKRQLGELEISELVSTLLLSDIAALPIGNQDIPLAYAIIPIVTITAFEVAFSFLLTKCPSLKNLLTAQPSVLICKGKINKKELAKNRISIEELLGELRQRAIVDISDVLYAILEQNGKLTVIQTADATVPNCRQLGIFSSERGLSHIIIADGKQSKYGLDAIGQDQNWLQNILRQKSLTEKDVFLLTVDDQENIKIITMGEIAE